MKICIPALVFLATLVQGCATSGQPAGKPVAPSESFSGSYINIKAPASAGWELMQSSGAGMAFAKDGENKSESFSAQIVMFNLPPTQTPEAFKSFIQFGVEKDTDTTRFKVQSASFRYTNERNYPCVRYEATSQDDKPQGSSGPLLLQLSAIYCQHPVRQETGFSVSYSHRGRALYSTFRNEAEIFIQGVQVP